MADEWQIAALEELYEFSSGLSKPRSAFGTGYPFVSFKDVFYNIFVPDELAELVQSTQQERDKCSVRRGDVFLTRTSETMNELGMSCVARRDMPDATFNGFTKRLRPKDARRVSPEYAGYYFRSPNFRQSVTAMSSMSTRASLNNEMLARLSITLPPFEEQVAIGHILGTLDDKIELNRRMNETLEATARALFKSWFVEFDPVRAMAGGRDSGLPKHISDLFPDSLESSELGEIPRGWGVGTLANSASLNPEVWTRTTRPPEIRYVDLSNTKWGRIEAVTSYAAVKAPSRAQRILKRGDTIVGTVRPGNGSYALVSEGGLTGSTGFAVLRPKSPNLTEFVYLAATALDNVEALAHLADGGAYPAIRPEVVAATPAAIPTSAVLTAFSSLTGPLLSKMGQNDLESRTLAGLRDALLPRLISGKQRVKDLKKFRTGAAP